MPTIADKGIEGTLELTEQIVIATRFKTCRSFICNPSGLLIAPLAMFIAVAFTVSANASDPPLKDQLVLKNGSILIGEVSEISDKQRFYLIKTEDGGIMKFRRTQVKRVIRPTDLDREYIAKKNAMQNTVDHHWKMQAWCQAKRLLKQREYHLMQVIKLDPDHKDARSLLNFKEQDGVWVNRDHFDQMHGYVKDKTGKFRLPQAIELHESQEEQHRAQKQMNRQLKVWLNKYQKNGDQEALNNLKQVKEGIAVEGLMKLIQDDEVGGRTKRMLLDIIGQIKSPAAHNALVYVAIQAINNENLSEQAITLLKQPQFNRGATVGIVLGWLRSKENWQVNRAAWLIGQMEDQEAVLPLINALVTTHVIQLGAGGGNMGASFGSDGVGMTQGKKKTKINRDFNNQQVLDALKLLTKDTNTQRDVDFGFNEQAWLNWYIRKNSVGNDQLNRDR